MISSLRAGVATLMIATAGYAPPPETCAAVTVAIRRNEGSPQSRMKSLGALDNVLAAREAAKRGAEEAILLNNAGSIACGARANLFAVIDGRLVTPPIADGVLPGIARRVVLEIAAAREIPMEAILAIGDGANDIPMIEAAGLGVAYHAKPAAAAAADARIDANDLTALLYAQGYARKDWIEV